MIDTITRAADTRMHKAIESLQHELAKVRTGRAIPACSITSGSIITDRKFRSVR